MVSVSTWTSADVFDGFWERSVPSVQVEIESPSQTSYRSLAFPCVHWKKYHEGIHWNHWRSNYTYVLLPTAAIVSYTDLQPLLAITNLEENVVEKARASQFHSLWYSSLLLKRTVLLSNRLPPQLLTLSCVRLLASFLEGVGVFLKQTGF